MAPSLRLRSPRTLPVLAAGALYRSMTANAAIIGAQSYNISSDSTQLTYVGTWRSDQDDGVYQAYSNASDAAVTFSFIGVGVAYLAEKKADRGLCQLAVDGKDYYTVDLYNDSGYSQGTQLVWDSGTLVYGSHNVTISQLGPDARFGYYPYLITETWIESVPVDVSSYTATMVRPSPTSNQVSSDNGHSAPGPIIGGVIGGVLAAFLLGFLFYLWRRDKAQRRRSEGAPVQKVKKAEGKFAIEDERPFNGGGDSGGGGEGAWAAAGGVRDYGYLQQDPYQHYDPGYGAGSGYQRPYSGGSDESYHNYKGPSASYSSPAPPPPPVAPHLAAYGNSPSSPKPYQASMGYSGGAGGTMSSAHRTYPYHEQGFGVESRRYPVPEI
ncbi:uncharacterized protein JCM15063_002604 [Sporobolomyces koalae]|uniref:uncharacterized protein n=1 Tax=Sporobolomyces koalae TaxID=500713 RepID=UPI0031806685